MDIQPIHDCISEVCVCSQNYIKSIKKLNSTVRSVLGRLHHKNVKVKWLREGKEIKETIGILNMFIPFDEEVELQFNTAWVSVSDTKTLKTIGIYNIWEIIDIEEI